jgi:hypothetical protein
VLSGEIKMKKYSFIALILITSLILSSCAFSITQGSGKVVTETRQVSGFDRVSLSGIGSLTITLGDKESLQIQAEDNILPRIETIVQDGTLIIRYQNNDFQKNVVPTKPINFYLTAKNINGLELSGAGSISSDKIDTDNLTVSSSGAGSVKIGSLTAQSLTANLSGVGGCEFAGKVINQNLVISGTGSYNAPNLESQNTTIIISGAGSSTVWSTSTLNVTISGAGSVSFYGNPTVTKTISGIGSVKSLGAHPQP